MKTKEFKVIGMSCKHCEATVNKAVSALCGVSKVCADAKNKKVKVVFDDNVVSEDNIIQAITNQDFIVE